MTTINPHHSRRVRDHYQEVIREIMTEHDLEPLSSSPKYVVPSHATFEEVLLHTDWYVHESDSVSHYRYWRYIEILREYLALPKERVVHVDIGCGAGVFSWPLLDWAMKKGIAHDSVDLYGFDHCEAMIRLARMIRNRLAQRISDYPHAHYSYRYRNFLDELQRQHHEDGHYIITLGHVLAQTLQHTPDDIDRFAQMIVSICEFGDADRPCDLVAADAKAKGENVQFLDGWGRLLDNLEAAGIECKQYTVSQTMNDDNCAKVAMIYPMR